jgi:phenylacetate-CoA ligase
LVEHATESGRSQAASQVRLASLRDERVRATVRYCCERSPHYRGKLEELGVEPSEIRGVDDLEQLPILLSKDDERELQERSRAEYGHPFGAHLCVDPAEVVSVAATSGSTGTPTFYAFTAADVALTDELWGRALGLAGVGQADVCLHGFGLSMYLAGVPLVRAIERLGAQAVPVGAEAGSEKLLKLGLLVGATVLLCTPSYASYLIEHAPEQMRALGLRRIICAGEPGAGLPEVRARIEEATGAVVHDALGGAHGIMNASDGAHPYDGMTVLAARGSGERRRRRDTRRRAAGVWRAGQNDVALAGAAATARCGRGRLRDAPCAGCQRRARDTGAGDREN